MGAPAAPASLHRRPPENERQSSGARHTNYAGGPARPLAPPPGRTPHVGTPPRRMFGGKLRSWMDAVRPKKKQHRKEKQGKNAPGTNCVKFQTPCPGEKTYETRKEPPTNQNSSTGLIKQMSRYSATNLSSPESAYSTGYSTDGTSPGAPPDYPINSPKTTETNGEIRDCRMSPSTYKANTNNSTTSYTLSPALSLNNRNQVKIYDVPKQRAHIDESKSSQGYRSVGESPAPVATSQLGVISPRQRNRIRTNPWLPSGNVASPLPSRNDVRLTPVLSKSAKNSPRDQRYLSPALRRRSISSSSCSSVSATSVHVDNCRQTSRSLSDDLEDDCTLNEMMGKYDESYIYEKETDILSDSDPTDCDSDIDTGQDGGDEDDTLEGEFDFIDNGSYLEFDTKSENNTGHCFYYVPADIQRNRSSRKRASRKSDRRRRSSSSKKRLVKFPEKERIPAAPLQESKSAGATPVSVRRSKSSMRPASRLAQRIDFKKRSNSVSSREPISTIDRKDREADMKYRELIGQAEQIIRTMNINGLSPRRLPGPANKRVELLRTAECKKEMLSHKDDSIVASNTVFSKLPSISNMCRFSPKKNHITNFILNHSPILLKKEMHDRRDLPEDGHLVFRNAHAHSPAKTRVNNNETDDKNNVLQPRSILLKSTPDNMANNNRRGMMQQNQVNCSNKESLLVPKDISQNCPQSEPMRRKVYFGQSGAKSDNAAAHGKSVAFNLSTNGCDNNPAGGEMVRQQVLLCTIQDIKRNLEDQSASLQQVYRSTQCIYKY